MAHHIIEFDEECKSCRGSGLYIGFAEKDGAAVVCHTCKGTGCHHVKIEYDDFIQRKDPTRRVERVFEVNPGIIMGKSGENKKYQLETFGGMPFKEWESGLPFPPKSENRRFTCPAWWYQSADYHKKPDWDECGWGAFSSCPHYNRKEKCWDRWDKEYLTKKGEKS